MITNTLLKRFPCSLLLTLSAACWLSSPTFSAPDQAPVHTYIAAGGSLGFGYTTAATTFPSYGVQGYVKPYAAWLTTQFGGVHPNVINTSIGGETTDTFFTGGKRGAYLNMNYASDYKEPQNTKLLDAIQSEKARGHIVSVISIQLGSNDIFDTIDQQGFTVLSSNTEKQDIAQILANVQVNYTQVLREVRAAAPDAQILVMGYYNPLGQMPGNPLYAVSWPTVEAINYLLAQEAQTFDATFVDLYTPFRGHESEWTYVGVLGYPAGFHANAIGYGVIAKTMEGVTKM